MFGMKKKAPRRTPNYDPKENAFASWDAIMLLFKALVNWPGQTVAIVVGFLFLLMGTPYFLVGLLANVEVEGEVDYLNPQQGPLVVGVTARKIVGGVGTVGAELVSNTVPVVAKTQQRLTPTFVEFVSGGETTPLQPSNVQTESGATLVRAVPTRSQFQVREVKNGQ